MTLTLETNHGIYDKADELFLIYLDLNSFPL